MSFPLYFYKAQVLRVIDGDTIDVNVDLGFHTVVRKRLRFLAFDAPETRTRDKVEKKRGLMCKKFLENLLSVGDLYIKTEMDATGKYGRVLAELFVKNKDGYYIDVISTLIANNFEKHNELEPIDDALVMDVQPWASR